MNYMINSSNLDKVEGTDKTDYTALAGRVTTAEEDIDALEAHASWQLAGSCVGNVSAGVNVPRTATEIFVKIGDTSGGGAFVTDFMPVAAVLAETGTWKDTYTEHCWGLPSGTFEVKYSYSASYINVVLEGFYGNADGQDKRASKTMKVFYR